MEYLESLNYMKKESGPGIRPGLSRIRLLLDKLGNPQNQKPVIHVAGTNGKGSVCTYISSILREAGYCIGRYISPAVYGYREILQIDGRWISQKDVARCLTKIRQTIENDEQLKNDRPTSFEIETAMAYLYLGTSAADLLVIETGMGGRLDATNVCEKPLVSVITSIGLDHMNFLGSTCKEIAYEKGGIIKPSRPVVFCSDDQEAADVLAKIARSRGSAFYPVCSKYILVFNDQESSDSRQIDDAYKLESTCKTYDAYKLERTCKTDDVYKLERTCKTDDVYKPESTCKAEDDRYFEGNSYPENTAPVWQEIPEYQFFRYKDMPVLKTSLLGLYEPLNASLAMQTAHVLNKTCNFNISERVIADGISKASWPGRFEVVRRDIPVIIDGAHNPAGARALRESLIRYLKGRKIILLMAVFADKEYDRILSIMSDLSDTLIAFKPVSERGLAADALCRAADAYFSCTFSADSYEEAVRKAYSLAKERHAAIVQFGTLSVIGETSALWSKII